MKKKESLLITGACGFIGSNFLDVIDYNKFKNILVIDNLSYSGDIKNIKEHIKQKKIFFLKKGIENRTILNDLKKYQITGIINFAAESHVDNSIMGPNIFFKTNVMGTLNLLNCFKIHYESIKPNHPLKKNFKFLHVSTDEVFGSLRPKDKSFTEESRYKPRNPYSASKAGSDHLCRSYFNTYNLPILITNCSNNYGPKQHPEKLIPKLIFNIMNNRPLPIYGKGKNSREWIYVKDHCEALIKVFKKGKIGEFYNIGSNKNLNNLEITKALLKVSSKIFNLGKKVKIKFVKDRPGHDFRYSINSDKIKQELKWNPNTKLNEGLEQTIKWYVENEKWWRSIVFDE